MSVGSTDIAALHLTTALHADTVSWDATRYVDKVSGTGTEIDVEEENQLLDKYPPLCPVAQVTDGEGLLPVIRGPAVIADRHGNILVWSLPDILPTSHQVLRSDDLAFSSLILYVASIRRRHAVTGEETQDAEGRGQAKPRTRVAICGTILPQGRQVEVRHIVLLRRLVQARTYRTSSGRALRTALTDEHVTTGPRCKPCGKRGA